jgi:hypothetical protein
MLYWLRGLRSRRSASSRRHNKDSTELEVQTATQSLETPHVSESIGKRVTAPVRVIYSNC